VGLLRRLTSSGAPDPPRNAFGELRRLRPDLIATYARTGRTTSRS